MAYEVRTDAFEGPFDLLLHLILREQVDLYEIRLSTIVDGFLGELDRLLSDGEGLDLDVATEFLLIAATLVELKARRLLPAGDDLDLDEELMPWEERDLLLARLIECKTFKDAARALALLVDRAALSWPRVAGLEEAFAELAPDPLSGVRPTRLRDACRRALSPKPEVRLTLDHVAPIRLSVADTVEELIRELPGAGRVTFRSLTVGVPDRLHVVVRFLALLELCKQGLVALDQAVRFGDIDVEWIGDVDVPDEVDVGLVDVYEG